MMELTDTHAHLYADEFLADREEMMNRAFSNGVKKIFLPNIDNGSIPSLLELEANYPGRCFAMMGLHPCSVKENVEEELQTVEEWLRKRAFSAVGEIGLDFYWDLSFREQQLYAFRRQVDLAKQYRIPFVIHSRNATRECIDIVREKQDGSLKGIFHCFSGSEDEAKQVTELGFYLGIGGVVTFKNAGLDKLVEKTALPLIVLETDAPYLAPVPYRGKRNESSYLRLVAEKIAAIKQVSLEEVAAITTENAAKIFND
ncbi:MAG TPA: TatD family hydrolase [Chitinophagaceae bacterium]